MKFCVLSFLSILTSFAPENNIRETYRQPFNPSIKVMLYQFLGSVVPGQDRHKIFFLTAILALPWTSTCQKYCLVFPLYYKRITFPCESCWMISPLPLFVTLISRSEYLVVNSFPPLFPIVPFSHTDTLMHCFLHTHTHTQVYTSLPVTLSRVIRRSLIFNLQLNGTQHMRRAR